MTPRARHVAGRTAVPFKESHANCDNISSHKRGYRSNLAERFHDSADIRLHLTLICSHCISGVNKWFISTMRLHYYNFLGSTHESKSSHLAKPFGTQPSCKELLVFWIGWMNAAQASGEDKFITFGISFAQKCGVLIDTPASRHREQTVLSAFSDETTAN